MATLDRQISARIAGLPPWALWLLGYAQIGLACGWLAYELDGPFLVGLGAGLFISAGIKLQIIAADKELHPQGGRHDG
jgi:hypothetical protein